MFTFCRDYVLMRERLVSFLPGASKPQVTNIALLVYGLIQAGDCRLRRIARHLPVRAGVGAARERLLRLMKNPALDPLVLYAPMAAFALCRFAGGRLPLILDASQLNGKVFWLSVALAYRGRAVPIGSVMLDKPSVSCRFDLQKQLLDWVAERLPPHVEVLLLGDRDYGTLELIRYCLNRRWHFCLRAKRNRIVRLADGSCLRLADLRLRPGQRRYLDAVRLPDLPQASLSLSCCLSEQAKDDDAWYILSDLQAGHQRVQEYAKRMLIDEMFRDFKEQGFRLECSGLLDPPRVSRLLLGICLAYVWIMLIGQWVVKNAQRRVAEGYGPRRLSYFTLGTNYLLHAWAHGLFMPSPVPGPVPKK